MVVICAKLKICGDPKQSLLRALSKMAAKNDVAVTIWNNQSKWSECSAQELQKSIFGCKEAAFHIKPSTVHTFLAQYMQMPSNACKCLCITLLKCWIFLISIQQDNNVSFATFDAGLGSWSFQRPEIHQSYPWPWAIWPWGWFPRCFVDACEGEKKAQHDCFK